jgi:3-phenylpropionate/trans-cinnamate dioxygenase ferredoxin subunit
MKIALATLRVGQQRCVNFDSRSVLVCRTEAGVFAVENRCSHAEFPLAGGKVSDEAIRCPTHGAKFDLRTGKPLTNPRIGPIKTYRVEIDGDHATLLPEECVQDGDQ